MKQTVLDPAYQLYTKVKFPTIFRWMRIILFEAVATLLLAYGIICSQYVNPPYPTPQNYKPTINPFHSIFCSCALFLCLSFAGQLTGAHCNPAVTITFMIVKDNKVTPLVALAYIVAQFIGALLGCLIGWSLIDTFTAPSTSGSPGYYVKQFFAELFGAFLFSLFILIITNDKTSFLRSNFWNYVLIPLMFFISREVTYQIDGINPATVLGLQLFVGIRHHDFAILQSYWLYFTGPIIGAILSALFFDYFYLPLFIRWKAKK